MASTTNHLVGLRLHANHHASTKSVPMQTPLGAETDSRTVAEHTSGHPSIDCSDFVASIPFSTPNPFYTSIVTSGQPL